MAVSLSPSDAPAVKICGITDEKALEAAINAGAAFIGLVFHAASPRHLKVEQAATLAEKAGKNVQKVGLFVDPEAETLQKIRRHVALDMIQLHGAEMPQKVQQIRIASGLPVIKAIRIAGAQDLQHIALYEQVADWLLFDAKSSKGQGGTGETFDWNLLAGLSLSTPWMLAGGLDKGNIGQALDILQPDAVDISSGVEDAPGIKNPAKIKEFIEAVRQKD